MVTHTFISALLGRQGKRTLNLRPALVYMTQSQNKWREDKRPPTVLCRVKETSMLESVLDKEEYTVSGLLGWKLLFKMLPSKSKHPWSKTKQEGLIANGKIIVKSWLLSINGKANQEKSQNSKLSYEDRVAEMNREQGMELSLQQKVEWKDVALSCCCDSLPVFPRVSLPCWLWDKEWHHSNFCNQISQQQETEQRLTALELSNISRRASGSGSFQHQGDARFYLQCL